MRLLSDFLLAYYYDTARLLLDYYWRGQIPIVYDYLNKKVLE